MLTETERKAAIEIVLSAKDGEKFSITTERLLQAFPNIEPDDLIAIWREAGERQMAEANELEAWGQRRQSQ